MHQIEVRVGGKSFTNFTTGKSYSFGGEYLELVPNARLRYMDNFDDPNLPGEIRVTVTLKEVSVSTDLSIEQSGLPDVIPLEACYLGGRNHYGTWHDSSSRRSRIDSKGVASVSNVDS